LVGTEFSLVSLSLTDADDVDHVLDLTAHVALCCVADGACT